MLNFSIAALRSFILIYVCTFAVGCTLIDWVFGEPIEKIHTKIDLDKDGKLTPEEIKASKYDLDKDGKLSVEEMLKATEGSDIPLTILGIMAALNVPFAAGAKIALSKLKENKEHVRAMAGGIEDLVNLKQDGITKKDIYKAIQISSKYRGDALALHKVVKEIKAEIRAKNEHIVVNTPNT